MMKLLTIDLIASLSWSMHPSDPAKFELDCLPGWSLVNPFLYANIAQQSDNSKVIPTSKATFINNDNFYINTQGFVLAQTDNRASLNVMDENFFWEWDAKLYQLVNYFRYASKQFSISPKMKSFGPLDVSELPPLVFPNIGSECATTAWPLRTAIDKSMIEIVSRQNLAEPPQIFDTMLLDALEAVAHEDYKTAVLFSSISMENLVRMKLDEAFDSAFDTTSINQALTLILRPEDDSETNKKRKNEIHSLLVDGPRFAQLIDKSSLILLGKSILLDNKALYDRAVSVYKNRNSIAHRGVLLDDADTRYAGIKQAREALQCAIQLVDWFGELGGYSNPLDPEGGYILCHTANLPDPGAPKSLLAM